MLDRNRQMTLLAALLPGALIFVFVAVVPRFAAVFEGLNVKLPAMTVLVIGCSRSPGALAGLVLAGVLVTVAGFRWPARAPWISSLVALAVLGVLGFTIWALAAPLLCVRGVHGE